MTLEAIDAYQLSPMQLGIVTDSPIGGAPSLDVVQVECEFEADLDHAAFTEAWQEMARRHDSLRTAFRFSGDGGVSQEVYAGVELPVEIVPPGGDWPGYVSADRARGFRLDRPPLMRCGLMPAADRHHFVFTFHHSVMDGRSLRILFNEVFAYYDGLRAGAPVQLPPAPAFRSFIDWLAAHGDAGGEGFWRGLLAGFDSPTLLADGREAGSSTRHAEHDLQLSLELSDRLRSLAREHGFTLNTIVQAAWAILLGRYCDREDVVFGAVRSVRRDTVPDADSLVGLLLNTLPVRARPMDRLSIVELLRELRAQAVAVREHPHTSLMEIQRWAETPPGERLFDTLVVYENFLLNDAMRAQGGAWEGRSFRLHRQPVYPMVLQVFAESAVLMKLVHDGAQFDHGNVAAMAGNLRAILQAIAANVDTRIGDLSLAGATPASPATPAEQETRFVAEHARATPDVPAIVAGGRTLTYRDLDLWANRLAHGLAERGVVREVVVALECTPEPETVAGLLGVLRAGGACLLLDPGLPARRRAEAIRACDARMLLTPAEVGTLAQGRPDHPPITRVRPGNACLIVDVGSASGTPRPLVLPHSALADLAGWLPAFAGITAEDRVARHADTCTVALLEIWSALAAGACLCPADDAQATVAFAAPARARPGPMRLVTVPGLTGELLWLPPDGGASVVDSRLRPVPDGVIGQLCLTGAGLPRGYHRAPAATADRFRPGASGTRLLLGGQRGRRRHGGLRLEPAAAETLLGEDPAVADAVVVTAGRGLAAFVTTETGQTVPVDRLWQRLRTALPHRLVPQHIVELPRLPLTGAGTLDHTELTRLAAAQAPVPAPSAAVSPLHQRIAAAWAQVLGCGEEGERALLAGAQDFFELGGHSLFAVTAALRLSDQLDAEIPARLIFDAPTVPAFAERVEALRASGGQPPPKKITPLPRR